MFEHNEIRGSQIMNKIDAGQGHGRDIIRSPKHLGATVGTAAKIPTLAMPRGSSMNLEVEAEIFSICLY